MATKSIYETLLDEKVNQFIHSYKEASRNLFFDQDESRLIHAGEFGRFREAASKDFIRFFIPRRLEIGTGFLMNHVGEVSTQVDLVVYDKNETPLVQDIENQYFYPVETVCAVGEVKSVLSKDDLKKALNKLSRVKSLRDRVAETNTQIIKANPTRGLVEKFDPVNKDADRLFSFLICEKLNFNLGNITNELNSMYDDDVKDRNKHNLILSIDDGLFLYKLSDDGEGTISHCPLPVISCPPCKNLKNVMLVPSNTDRYHHFKIFCTYLFSRTESTSILSPDLAHYMGRYNKSTFQVEA